MKRCGDGTWGGTPEYSEENPHLQISESRNLLSPFRANNAIFIPHRPQMISQNSGSANIAAARRLQRI